MTEQSTPTAASSESGRIDDLFKLTLVDGLKAQLGGKEITYRLVRLRETTVADERRAEREAERAVLVNGAWRLLVSDSTFKHLLNLYHIESLTCDQTTLSGSHIDVELYDRLSPRDLKAIEERIFLITLSSEVRYGNMTQDEFDLIVQGLAPVSGAQTPQPSGQTSDVGAAAQHAESGPALLADYAGDDAKGKGHGAGGPTVEGRAV